MNINEINPYIRLAVKNSTIPRQHTINRRVILDYELLYIQEGNFTMTYNNRDFFINTGDILLICPNISHSFHDVITDVKQPHIHFDIKYDSYSTDVYICYKNSLDLSPSDLLMIRENIFPNLVHTPFFTINNRDTFFQLFFSILDSKDKNGLATKIQMLKLLNLIISENTPAAFTQSQNKENIVYQIKNYIDANYEHNFRLSDLEQLFSYSKYYIDKLFKEELGISVIKYRNQLRLIHSIPLLQKYSVTKTAQLLNFSSISAFNKAFCNFYNESPTKYIRKLSEQQTQSQKQLPTSQLP